VPPRIAASASAKVVTLPDGLKSADVRVPNIGLGPAARGRITPPATPGAPVWMWAAASAPDRPLYSTK